jgi:hypothetical protein
MNKPKYIKTSPAFLQALKRVLEQEQKLASIPSPQGLTSLFPALITKACKGYAEIA